MGVVGAILGLPLAPVRGVLAVAELIRRQVDAELYHPASVRRELEAVDEARAAGEISPEEEAETQQRVLDRLTASAPRSPERRPNEEER
ncbi:gas vesicle protein GvpG [Amycolatopsis eburnea]|uniref:Gas vesicle protein G n=1 Tax=Amycolatopsis eburnea TaxID=2267691 RepID=A0A3R9DSV7_9PSEU|nr:gas vesicle protein GvpG [Amycolatopsis eburnea]RSD11684.1 gas vesicle protein G [Amycolatopsis eburnea]